MGMILFIAIAIISFGVQWRFKNKFKQYSEAPLASGMSGKDIALKMLHDHNIYDVQVLSSEGRLSDHYNPADRTVNLSPEVYEGRSIASAAVAAHECGHAIQHAKAYSWLTLRSAVVPMVNIASKMTSVVLMIGVILFFTSGSPLLLAIGVGALAVTTAFTFITLPVEFDASNRALAWLKLNPSILADSVEHSGAKDALKWAAMTYVVAALSSLATLLYYASFLFGSRE